MNPIRMVRGIAAPLPLKDVDTDMIIPAQYLTSIGREGFGENLFRRLRDADPGFVLNRPEFANAKILLSGSNFGCGSSREHAVWALKDAGFDAVIAPSFADIFSGNAGKNALLLVPLPGGAVERLLARAEATGYELVIDLAAQTVTTPEGEAHSFEIDPFRKHCLLNGLDDLDYILSHKREIESHFASAPRFFSPPGKP